MNKIIVCVLSVLVLFGCTKSDIGNEVDNKPKNSVAEKRALEDNWKEHIYEKSNSSFSIYLPEEFSAYEDETPQGSKAYIDKKSRARLVLISFSKKDVLDPSVYSKSQITESMILELSFDAQVEVLKEQAENFKIINEKTGGKTGHKIVRTLAFSGKVKEGECCSVVSLIGFEDSEDWLSIIQVCKPKDWHKYEKIFSDMIDSIELVKK